MNTSLSPVVSDDGTRSPKSWVARDALSTSDGMQSPDCKVGGSLAEVDPQNEDSDDPMSSIPVQKRRRVTRACDECRRKKIKCDGKQPCTHCSVYSYECTYDKPSNRRRNPAPQYVEALENRLRRAESLLRKFMPDVDLTDSTLDPVVQQEFQNRERARAKAAKLARAEQGQQEQKEQQQDQKQQESTAPTPQSRADDRRSVDSDGEQIRSMIRTVGQLDLTEAGEFNFHGSSSGRVFVRRMKEQFFSLLGHDSLVSWLGNPPHYPGIFNLDSPSSTEGSPAGSSLPSYYILPPKEHARKLCALSLHSATCLLRFVHIPSFDELFENLYAKGPSRLGEEDHRALSLFYSALALGATYNVSASDDPVTVSYKTAIEEGIKYYTIARMLLQEITECCDMLSLQALLFFIFFLQATSNLTRCYSFIGIALRAALRMGLHRNLPHVKLTPIETELRRRVFYVILQMDTYVSALLGFPLSMRPEDIDQLLPTEVDDEYITKDGIFTPPAGTPSFFQASNAYTRLITILTKVIKYIYPLKPVDDSPTRKEGQDTIYMISFALIKEIEDDLHDWYEKLPIYWRPSPEGSIEVIRVRTLLRFAYAHVQMMLYRPFIHYVSPRLAAQQAVDERYYACAAAAVSVSRNIVHIGMEMRKQSVLLGPFWFILFTEFFGILSLVYYCLENPEKPGSSEIMADAIGGKEVIAGLSQISLSADRVTAALNILFDNLPDHLQKMASRPVSSTKKRSAPYSNPRQPSTVAVAVPTSMPGMPNIPTKRPSITDQPRQPQSHPISLNAAAMAQPPMQQMMSNFPDTMLLDATSNASSPHASEAPSLGSRPPGSSGYLSQQNGPRPRAVANAPLSVAPGMLPSAAPIIPASLPTRMLPAEAGVAMPNAGANAFYELKAAMFSSVDPFAYPNPPVDLNLQGFDGVSQTGIGTRMPDTTEQQQLVNNLMQFYPSAMFDDLESHLFGSLPAYLMQTPGPPNFGAHQGSQFAVPTNLAQQAQQHNAQQRQQQQQQQQQLQQPQQPQQQQVGEMFVDSDFDNVLASQFRPA